MVENFPFNASAVLVWLDPEQRTNEISFHPALSTSEPPCPNPEPWWVVKDAILYAVELENKHGKVPWIKVGNVVLSPADIATAYNAIKRPGNE